MAATFRRAAVILTLLLGAASATQAQPVSLSPDGIGQVLIYPYYTVRNGWTTLLSIVNNDSANGKAVKVRFLEGKNGASVASFNLFLGPDDIWTGAVLPGASDEQPARLVSKDNSCTYPLLNPFPPPASSGAGLSFSNQAYVADGDSLALQTLDRTREGYIEVIEMASIPLDRSSPSALMKLIYPFFGFSYQQDACGLLSDAELSKYAAQISPPTGGLSGAATLLNAFGGSSAEYTPVALNGFWTTSSSLTPALTASTASTPNLSSGGNTTAQYFYDGKTYFSKFSRSIDSVSATLMSTELLGEHAHTKDGVIGTTWVVSVPTKRFYTQGDATPPFVRKWDIATGVACDDATFTSADRNAYVDRIPPDVGTRPPGPILGLCFATGALNFDPYNVYGTANGIFYDVFAVNRPGTQNGGSDVIIAGKEGGKTRLKPSSLSATLTSISGSVTTVDLATGQLNTVFGPHTLYGLPMIGVAFSQSSFKTGNPQQNYASGFRLQSTRRITTP